MRYEEGPQYLVNRITFKGNTTTRDNVILVCHALSGDAHAAEDGRVVHGGARDEEPGAVGLVAHPQDIGGRPANQPLDGLADVAEDAVGIGREDHDRCAGAARCGRGRARS